MRAKLFCRTGELAGVEHQIGDTATIGRGEGNTLTLPSSVISQAHARIVLDADRQRYVLEDLQSRNGTQVDGVTVETQRPLGDLHVITLGGQHDFLFVTIPGAAGAEPTGAAPPETVRDVAPVIAMPDLVDAPAAAAPPPDPAAATMQEAPSALAVPALERGDSSATVREIPAPLEVPALEGVTPAAPTGRGPAREVRVVLEITGADGRTRRVALGPGRHGVGRSPDCAVAIDDRTLSRRHAVLVVTSDVVTIEDTGSRNGTYIAGVAVTDPVPVAPGAVVTFGDHVTARLLDAPEEG